MKRSRFGQFAIALLLAFRSFDAVAAWERIAEAPAGEVYVDRTSVKRMGGLATMVALTNLRPSPSVSNPPPAFGSIAQVDDFDCVARRIRLSGFILYAGPMATGKMLLNSPQDMPWFDVVDNEWNLRKWQIACGGSPVTPPRQ